MSIKGVENTKTADHENWVIRGAGHEEKAIISSAAAQTFALMMQNTAALQQSMFTILNAMASKALSNMAENAPQDAVNSIGTLLQNTSSVDQIAKIIELANTGTITPQTPPAGNDPGKGKPTHGGPEQDQQDQVPDGPGEGGPGQDWAG